MNRTKLAGAFALALAIGLPTAASASIPDQRNDWLDIDRQATALDIDLSVARYRSYSDQRDPSLSHGGAVQFRGFALSAGGSRSASFDREAGSARRQALDH